MLAGSNGRVRWRGCRFRRLRCRLQRSGEFAEHRLLASLDVGAAAGAPFEVYETCDVSFGGPDARRVCEGAENGGEATNKRVTKSAREASCSLPYGLVALTSR
jgi:hypothetical protein